jgi:hypothetical protein
MSYIGLPPKATFSSGLLDRFTSTTGTTVTLTNDIASENDIVVFVNFVKQDSTTYSVGGTGNKTLTLGGTLVSSDIVEVHYLNIVGQTVNPSANSVGSSQLTADVITGQTELASGVASTDELLISDAGTLKRVDVSLIGGTNTPSFRAYMGATQNLNDVTNTVVAYNTEAFDTDSAYDTSTYRFTVPSGKAGKYFFSAFAYFNDPSLALYSLDIKIRRNGANISGGNFGVTSSSFYNGIFGTNTVMDLSVGDYVDVNAIGNTSDSGAFQLFTTSNYEFSGFQGFKLL